MINASLKQLSQALAAKQISSVELTQLFLERIARLNPTLNAFVTVDPEKSLKMARAADARLAAASGVKPAGSLTGIPIAQKDIFCAEGWRTTCGSKMLANFISPYDATVIRKMEAEAGLVSLGKTNMDEFAMGSSNETSTSARCATRGTTSAFPAVLPAVRRQRSLPVWRRRRPAPTPAARSANQRRCAT